MLAKAVPLMARLPREEALAAVVNAAQAEAPLRLSGEGRVRRSSRTAGNNERSFQLRYGLDARRGGRRARSRPYQYPA